MFRALLAATLLLTVSITCAQCAQPTNVSKADAVAWIRYTVPLPKSISIPAAVAVPKSSVVIETAVKGDIVVDQAVKELRDLFGPGSSGASFKITLQMGGPESEKLKALKNSDQAYLIFPEGPGFGNPGPGGGRDGAVGQASGLRLVALAPRGIYYAAKTLQQLVAAKATQDSVQIPLMTVTDWPDMADRGLWGSDSYDWIPWLADRKMNLVEQISNCGVDDEGKAFGKLKQGREAMVTEGPQRGVEPMPAVLHLDQVGGKGVFKRYPNLEGHGGKEWTICYSQPEFPQVLADWLVDLKSIPGVPEVDVWMAENCRGQGGCKCAECGKYDRNVLEAMTILKAWEIAKKKIGYFPIRVMTSEETLNSNPKIFAILPPDVKVSYYHSLLTYTCAKYPMIWPNIAAEAAKGRGITVVPNLGPEVSKCSPFTGPEFIHFRMQEFLDKKMIGLQGFATPLIKFQKFNTEAAGEWSWNTNGRSPREFALSWAVREGMKNPEKFAEWSDAYNNPGWNLNGSDWPYGEIKYYPGPIATMLKDCKLPPLGSVLWEQWHGPWGDIKSEASFEQDLRDADKAVRIARELDDRPEFLQESLFTKHGIYALKDVYDLGKIVKPGGIAVSDRTRAAKLFKDYDAHLRGANAALKAWNDILAPESKDDRFTAGTSEIIDQAIKDMRAVAAGFGIEIGDTQAL